MESPVGDGPAAVVPSAPPRSAGATGDKPEKVQKAAPKKGRRRGAAAEPVVVTPELLEGIPFFAHLDPELRARLAPRMAHIELSRGEDLFTGGQLADDDSPVFLLLFGDVTVYRTGAEGEKITNFLRPGEAYVQKLFVRDDTKALRLTAMCPVKALRLHYRDMNYAMKQSPAFREAFGEAIRTVTARQRDRFDDARQGDIARFIVDQRLTFAGRVKLKRMDICIECDGCYDACRSRHGTDRLGGSEVKYGLTEVPQNCHNCVVPECLDKCKFGHLSRHPETHEIIISDNCVGCTMCAQGCSFGAIRMHPVAELDMAKYFPDRKGDHSGQNIAQKCDNCSGYDDQACITACPTGAMFQIDGPELFDYWQQFNVHKTPGFGEVATPVSAGHSSRALWLWFSMLQILVVTWEIFTRLWWPEWSMTQLAFDLGWLSTGVDAAKPLTAGGLFGHSLGWIGTGCMVGTQLYRIGKAAAPKLGSVQAWMESHIWLGILAGVYGFYHTAFILREPIAVTTFVLMMVAILTGGVGRYLLFLVPRSKAGQQMAISEIEARIESLNRTIESKFKDRRVGYTVMTRIADLAAIERAAAGGDDEQESTRLLPGVMKLLSEDRKGRKQVESLAGEVAKEAQAGQAQEILTLLAEKSRLERSTRRHGLLEKILKRYRVVHVVSSNILFGALAIHIVRSLMYLVG